MVPPLRHLFMNFFNIVVLPRPLTAVKMEFGRDSFLFTGARVYTPAALSLIRP